MLEPLSRWGLRSLSILACAALVACPKNDGTPGGVGPVSDAGAGGGNVVHDDGGAPDGGPGVVEPDPTSPKDDGGGKLAWPAASLLDGVMVAPGRDGAVLVLPAVPGAMDYRAFAIPAGIAIEADATGHETVVGTTIYCAGYRQHNAPAAAAELLGQLEIAGLAGKTRIVVEAVDAPCPFAGVQGSKHADVDVENVEVAAADRGPFSVYTDTEIAQRYGSLIVNGHAPGEHVGAQAPVAPPKVLARTTLAVTPLGTGTLPLPFFEDFSGNDQPAFVSALDGHGRSQQGALYENGRWEFLTYGASLSQMFLDRGRLHTLLADWDQDIMSTNIAYPRRTVQLSATDYLHLTFEVPTDSTQRRYWWLFLCGADAAGGTMDAAGRLLGNIIQTPFFYQDDGLNPSIEAWNCLQIFPRDGYAFPLPPTNTNPESDVRVMVNLPDKPPHEGVVDVSPPMYPAAIGKPSWYRQRDGAGNLVAPMLDDQMLVAPSTHLDVYIRRDRVILYANGEQRLCNDFPSVALTMPEAALGFGQVFYHSAAERLEFEASYWVRTGQRYYLQNTPFIDARAWDNLGFAEHVAAPAGFSPSSCFVYAP